MHSLFLGVRMDLRGLVQCLIMYPLLIESRGYVVSGLFLEIQ